jgi:hypothetical protein
MLVNQLRMRIPSQQHRKIVEPGDNPLEFHPVHQENGYRRFILPNMVQKHVLNVLAFFGHFLAPPFFGFFGFPGLSGLPRLPA